MSENYSKTDLLHIAEELIENLRECEDGTRNTTRLLLRDAGYDIDEFDVDLLRQVFEQLLAGEHVLAEVLGGALLGWLDVERALLECLLHDLESEIIGHLSVILFVSLLFSLYSGE